MDYFRILNLKREPFSNSPDPELFYQSNQHLGCLQQLELSVRLRRGLNVVIGEVGTGKTTLCRQLIRKLGDDEAIETHLILDPYFEGPQEFLSAFAAMLLGQRPSRESGEFQLKESIKKYLFQRGIDEDKTVVMILDEGQKIPDFCLELLREFLNYETNDRKLLQIVIFAQTEFDLVLKSHPNFADRINLYHFLKPLNFRDTRLMILHRITQSSSSPTGLSFFSLPSLWAIYRATGGYPRKIVTLCHRSILAMIIQNRSKAGWKLVRSSANRVFSEKPARAFRLQPAALVLSIALLVLIGVYYGSARTPSPRFIDPVVLGNQMETPKGAVKPNAAGVVLGIGSEIESDTFSPSKPTKRPLVPIPTGIESSDLTVTSEISPPLMLGQTTIQQSETFGELIQKVYGRATARYVNQVVVANPHIVDPDNLSVGDRIKFPALQVTASYPSGKYWWIKVDSRYTLGDALDLIRSYPNQDGPIRLNPLRLVPYWHHREGLRFSVMLGTVFRDEASALEELDRLPEALTANGKVISDWNREAVYYADPYLAKTPWENLAENIP